MSWVPRIAAALIYGLLAVVMIAAASKCRRQAQDAKALAVAREVIRYERDTLKITHRMDMRVRAEGLVIEQRATAAAAAIEEIRNANPAPSDRCDDDCRDVVRIATEARNAARAAAAGLQSENPRPR